MLRFIIYNGRLTQRPCEESVQFREFLLPWCFVVPQFSQQTPVRPAQDAEASSRVAVPRGTEPVDVIVTVVAMSKEPWLNITEYSYEILLLRVDKADATMRALELAQPGESFRIDEIFEQCPLRGMKPPSAPAKNHAVN